MHTLLCCSVKMFILCVFVCLHVCMCACVYVYFVQVLNSKQLLKDALIGSFKVQFVAMPLACSRMARFHSHVIIPFPV